MDEKPRVWWPQEFWMQRSVPTEEFKSAFREKFPEGKITIDTDIADYPTFHYFELLVPSEERTVLDSFLAEFCASRGSSLEKMPYRAEPEPGILPTLPEEPFPLSGPPPSNRDH